ncbi:hypothetical protein CDG24_25185 [Salmonella enterica subsp. enterica serovar Newport]|nr:hypothetical protein [Salmonella enterica subsp. enterica serovar Newport]
MAITQRSLQNLKPEGRPKGTPNKTTKERTEAFRRKLDETNVLFKAVELMAWRLDNEPDNIKTADLLKMISTVAPYLVQSVNMDEIAESIKAISSREDAEKVAQELAEKVKLLRVV